MKSAIAKLVSNKPLDNMADIFSFILSGKASSAQIAAFLTALHIKGESANDIAAGASIMKKNMVRVKAPADAIDVCGTGGDMKSTLNISTAVALVVAASGVVVAKHGNRAQSSNSGSADLLEELGVNFENAERSINELGIGFMFAQTHHKAMKNVAPVRTQLGFRTIFNLLGPLCNPASVKRQLVGVFDKKYLLPIANALLELGAKKAWVVCGNDGMDELTTTTTSNVAELANGKIKTFELNPEDFGIAKASLDSLKGGKPPENKKAFISMLKGEGGAYRDIVLLNSAAALVVADRVENIKEGLVKATSALDERAKELLQKWIEHSNE